MTHTGILKEKEDWIAQSTRDVQLAEQQRDEMVKKVDKATTMCDRLQFDLNQLKQILSHLKALEIAAAKELPTLAPPSPLSAIVPRAGVSISYLTNEYLLFFCGKCHQAISGAHSCAFLHGKQAYIYTASLEVLAKWMSVSLFIYSIDGN